MSENDVFFKKAGSFPVSIDFKEILGNLMTFGRKIPSESVEDLLYLKKASFLLVCCRHYYHLNSLNETENLLHTIFVCVNVYDSKMEVVEF